MGYQVMPIKNIYARLSSLCYADQKVAQIRAVVVQIWTIYMRAAFWVSFKSKTSIYINVLKPDMKEPGHLG